MMKKFVSGVLVGFLLAVPAFAVAEQVTMIGKTVQNEYPVIVDGRQLEVNAVAIDGKSYVPIRAVGEATGRKVEFRDKKVILTKIETEQPSSEEGGQVEVQTPSMPSTTPITKQPNYTLENIDEFISGKQGEINALLMMIGMAESGGQPQEKIDELKAKLSQAQQELERLRQIKAELEAQQ